MIHYHHLVVVGTSHIAQESLKEISEVIQKERPSLVALELDRGRFKGLVSGEKGKIRFRDSSKIGVKGYFFALIGEFAERKLGDVVGVKPGEDMLRAVEEARKIGAKIALIDQPIEKTLKRFSEVLTWKEKGKFVKDFFAHLFRRNKKLPFDLRSVPNDDMIKKLLEKFKGDYPSIYHVLVVERNVVMARRLHQLMKDYEKIVAVVGAGHEEGLIDELERIS